MAWQDEQRVFSGDWYEITRASWRFDDGVRPIELVRFKDRIWVRTTNEGPAWTEVVEPPVGSYLYRTDLFFKYSDWLDRQELVTDFPVPALSEGAL